MGFRDFKRVQRGFDDNVHLTVTNAKVDIAHERFRYDVDVRGIPKHDGGQYILNNWDNDWFPSDYLAIQRTGPGTYRLYIGDGCSFPVADCETVRPPRC